MTPRTRSSYVLLTLVAAVGLTLAACDQNPTGPSAARKPIQGPHSRRDVDSSSCFSGYLIINGIVVCDTVNGGH